MCSTYTLGAKARPDYENKQGCLQIRPERKQPQNNLRTSNFKIQFILVSVSNCQAYLGKRYIPARPIKRCLVPCVFCIIERAMNTFL